MSSNDEINALKKEIKDLLKEAKKLSSKRKNRDTSDDTSSKRSKVEEKTAHIVLCVDRSGSMRTYNAFDNTSDAITDIPKERGENARISFMTFDDKIEWHGKNMLAKSFKPTPECMSPRGTTALRDAIMESIKHSNQEEYKDMQKYIIIFTDGYDNVSKTSVQSLKAVIEKAKSNGIDFTFLAAGEADFIDVSSVGIEQKDMLKVGKSNRSMNSSLKRSMGKRAGGFTKEDRDDVDSDDDSDKKPVVTSL
tara:strand:+ start:74 stop:823 length:750 start_codon:yes stop_codon:yes gene_type:complete